MGRQRATMRGKCSIVPVLAATSFVIYGLGMNLIMRRLILNQRRNYRLQRLLHVLSPLARVCGSKNLAISLHAAGLNDENVDSICALIDLGVLSCLDLSANSLSPEAINGILVTSGIHHIRKLDLSRIFVASHDSFHRFAKVVSKALQASTSLQYLSIAGNDVGSSGAAEIAQALAFSAQCPLQHLNMSDTATGDLGMACLSVSLRMNQSLLHLSLHNNGITCVGIKHLSRTLATLNNTLQGIDLSDNRIAASGAAAILGAVSINTAMTTLNMNNNPLIGCEIGSFLRRINLRHLSLSSCHMMPEFAYGSYAQPCSLVSLVLDKNIVGDEGGELLAQFLMHEKSQLKTLSLRMCRIGNVGSRHFARVLRDGASPMLSSLFLEGNQIGPDAAIELAMSIEHHPTLLSVDLAYNDFWHNAEVQAELDAMFQQKRRQRKTDVASTVLQALLRSPSSPLFVTNKALFEPRIIDIIIEQVGVGSMMPSSSSRVSCPREMPELVSQNVMF